jgi:hypothetical protein
MNLSFSWWVYLASGAAYTVWIFIGELVKRQRRIFSKRNPRPVRTTLCIHALFLALLTEYIQAAPSLASVLPSYLTTPATLRSRFYLPPVIWFLVGVAALSLIERSWLYSELPTESADPEVEGESHRDGS